VALTGAGRALLPKARAAIQAFNAAAAAVKSASIDTSRIRIAFPSDTSPEVLLDLVKTICPNGSEVDIVEATTAEQHELLRAGELDIGVLRHPYETNGLWSSPPLRQTLGVVMPSNHPLARRKELELRELQTNTLIMFPRLIAPGLYDDLLETCRMQGYKPKRIVYGIRMAAGLMVAESAITFRPAHFIVPGPVGQTPDLTWRPLVGEPLHWWTSAVCQRKDPERRTRAAVQVILQALQRHDHWSLGTSDRRAKCDGSGGGG
jgi:DNA-binding transcriptional LysR family regulator